MKVSKLTRRALLGATAGMSQLTLLERFAPNMARAASPNAPSRILTIYLQGGYVPQYMWSPLKADEVAAQIPAPQETLGENLFFTADHVMEYSNAGDGTFPRIRGVRTWNPTAPGDRGAGYAYL